MDKKHMDLGTLLAKMKFSKIDFVRGLGIIENRFELSFECETEKIDFEIETNFRIRDDETVLLNYNDLYLDVNRNEMSVRKYRSQTNIEKSYLFKQLTLVNAILQNLNPESVVMKSYGDIYISFAKSSITIEIFNDTHLEGATLYRVKYTKNEDIDTYECDIKNNRLVLLSLSEK